ncbi:chemotaxis protein CheW [Frateuria terrea]|uniref:CheW protein n=1 Tax=Frateuria terrea TaxID=529704 RepID=A0A1H6U903_9GAMM|nr:chemotaxis protein CheW [Frateuria terrea]SEI88801.1 CheW protein [Frateuria terrea]SFP37520.1 CheW protein [Frateuria terrea]
MNPLEKPDAAARAVLRTRAQQLARVPASQPTDATVDVLEFGLASERYALLASKVHDVQPLRELTPLPCTPPFLRGLVNIRGRLVPVIDLKKFFELPERGITDLHRVLLLRNAEVEIGLLADTIEGVFALGTHDIQPPPATLAGIAAEYITGVTAERLVVLDADAILGDPRLVIEEEVIS